jgi:hypothetical protein
MCDIYEILKKAAVKNLAKKHTNKVYITLWHDGCILFAYNLVVCLSSPT